jgi:hypothetical protein
MVVQASQAFAAGIVGYDSHRRCVYDTDRIEREVAEPHEDRLSIVGETLATEALIPF